MQSPDIINYNPPGFSVTFSTLFIPLVMLVAVFLFKAEMTGMINKVKGIFKWIAGLFRKFFKGVWRLFKGIGWLFRGIFRWLTRLP